MPYAVAADMHARYPAKDLIQITDPNGVACNDANLTLALGDASDEIDGYLQGRYELPLVNVPATLVERCCTIAMYKLQKLRPQSDVEDARKQYEDQTRYFEKVAAGTISLGLSSTSQPIAPVADTTIVQVAPRKMTTHDLRGF